MEEEVYVQAIGIKMKLPNGEEAFAKFMGLAICEPEEWEKLKDSNESLVEALAEGKSLLFQDPIPLRDAIADKKDYNDLVDLIREELRQDHHDELKEKED